MLNVYYLQICFYSNEVIFFLMAEGAYEGTCKCLGPTKVIMQPWLSYIILPNDS